ncbi:MAG: DUF4235 domain-containing protein [Propionicimonas sp.]
MAVARKLLWNVYAGAAGAVAALAVNKALKGVWHAATGDEPPAVDDPRTSTREDSAFDALLTGDSSFDDLPAVLAELADGRRDALCHTVSYGAQPVEDAGEAECSA